MNEEVIIEQQDGIAGTFLYFTDKNVTFEVVNEFMFQVKDYLYGRGIYFVEGINNNVFLDNNECFDVIQGEIGELSEIILKPGIELKDVEECYGIKSEMLKTAMQDKYVQRDTRMHLEKNKNKTQIFVKRM